MKGETAASKSNNDWNFGMFNNTSGKSKGGSSGGSGRPIGGNEGSDRDKWLMFGAVGTVAFFAAIAYFEMGYREIGWKEFLNKLVDFTFVDLLNFFIGLFF